MAVRPVLRMGDPRDERTFIGPLVGALVGGGIGYFTADKRR